MMHISNTRPSAPQSITASEALLATIGLEPCDLLRIASGADASDPGQARFGTELSLDVEHKIIMSIKLWSKFCGNMAQRYVEDFADAPLILISNPSPEMCRKHNIPDSRDFLSRTLGRIIENIGPDYVVDVVDCHHDPLTDPLLAAQAGHWIESFFKLSHEIARRCGHQIALNPPKN
ncbi:MAG: hypothetical protein VR71_11455 [Roseovarius sp. BRH_c41]|nr:MAG: hypothetical protein VR71_11455 [Roseovarius sp. BRH_c41]